MRLSGFVAGAAALTLVLATLPAGAASDRQHRGGAAHRQAANSPEDTMADQLNARSLQRAQSGADASGSSLGGGMGMQGGGTGMPGGSSLGVQGGTGSGMSGSGMGRMDGQGSGMGRPMR